MTVDYIIIGQGLCGTWLSYYLLKENKSVIVFDRLNDISASRVASGLINPVTGRRVVTTWMAGELLPFVQQEYSEAGMQFGATYLQQKNILAFPSAPDLQNAFQARINEKNSFIHKPVEKKETFYSTFNFPFDVFEIAPCFVVTLHDFLNDFRKHLQQKNLLFDENFEENELHFHKGFVEYKNFRAGKIIYTNGIQASFSPHWMKLPFVQNKGQALIAEIKNLNKDYSYKTGQLSLIPLQENLWWIGSSNELNFSTNLPTEDFKQRTVLSLQSVLKLPFTIKEHLSSLRPATVERRPFVGIHPCNNHLAILNGMGSKGCSLAPWFAKQLAKNLIYGIAIDPLADIKRYSKILK